MDTTGNDANVSSVHRLASAEALRLRDETWASEVIDFDDTIRDPAADEALTRELQGEEEGVTPSLLLSELPDEIVANSRPSVATEDLSDLRNI
mmetsp:Transcript_44777/g.116183  ORF Transcript_44777/g.116183 Transcript_44777/m.116183 type:complete len:93 (-) Transcript_44777:386-664(-)|eukprot:CAMPEP_0113905098 /NCGR_PEP_ID=MMETSP0780_2-20120614/23766_1 /TAXON_ID=652834 /ORGANISM="Palpitomonas bilix" /LENGTH=92 /DNA_ID=CAMNT_0000899075 /DNA_START=103 /DNA_END=381 /DNA_ORIENTATION=- /assembly_acc=CAM_ASM_000599